MTDAHLILFDASGFAFRAYFSGNPIYRDDGLPIWAALGFLGLVWRTLGAAEADRPTHGAAVFDTDGKNFRHALFPAYKAGRDPARRNELMPQWPYIRHGAETMGMKPVEVEGFEADDVIATLASRAARDGMRVTIVSSDKDFAQLVEDGKIEIIDPMQRRRILSADVEKKFGVPPRLVPDVQALAGDAVDGIPGIAGCGMARAGALVRRFGNLEGVLRNADKCSWPQVRTLLKRRASDARLFKKLTTLRRNVAVPVTWDELKRQPVMVSHLKEIVRALGAEARFESIFQTDPQMVRIVSKTADPFEWWREELAAPGQPIPDEPQCGFFQRRLVRGGPWVAAKIWREPETDPVTGEPTGRDYVRCRLGTKFVDPLAEWHRLATKPIKESDYRYEEADADHARRYRPDDPKNTPTKPFDLMKLPAPQAPKQRAKKRKTA